MSRIAEYNAQFASRFCAEDAEFQRYRERAADPPPVLEEWRARGRRDKRVPDQWPQERHNRRWSDRGDERKSAHDSHSQRSHYRHL
ncbi:RNA guanine-N7 methyltransferase activating subunit-like [Triplophysa dalaica]|uniref:RNA guanine-N7 methyltransferase activating subunit-like n=1 Tax=Triplophysa dalaica TaxID=1582913 RepID=UPI0024DF6829|nr:RNA guanine-N7 methyltransferase activating subunit-like [Triplophysa dalaica]